MPGADGKMEPNCDAGRVGNTSSARPWLWFLAWVNVAAWLGVFFLPRPLAEACVPFGVFTLPVLLIWWPVVGFSAIARSRLVPYAWLVFVASFVAGMGPPVPLLIMICWLFAVLSLPVLAIWWLAWLSFDAITKTRPKGFLSVPFAVGMSVALLWLGS